MKVGFVWTVALSSAVCVGCGTSERVRAAQQYEKAACACKDKACAEAASRVYSDATCGKGVNGATFVCVEKGKTFTSPSESEARSMEEPEMRAEGCVARFIPRRATCGGIAGKTCPDGGRCLMNPADEGMTDQQGQCYGPDEKPSSK